MSGLHAQAVADSLVQRADTLVQRVDTLVQRADSVIPAAALPILADTVAQAADTTATDTLQRRPPRPTLPALMRPYFVLKLMRDPASNIVRLDTVSVAYERILGVLEYLNDPAIPERYIRVNPDYHRLFLPFTYFKRPMARISRMPWRFSGGDALKTSVPCPLQVDTLPFTRQQQVDEAVDHALLAAYVNHLDLVRFTEDKIKEGPSYHDNIEKEEESRPSVLKLFKSESMGYIKPEDAGVVIHKPNWWVTGGNGSIQFSQSHISKNWYNGGEGTHSLLGNLQLFANYNDREKWQWENLLDAKLGYISAPSDEYHSYLVNNDQLRIASKVGLRAVKHWYYTLHTEFKTQFCNGYGANSLILDLRSRYGLQAEQGEGNALRPFGSYHLYNEDSHQPRRGRSGSWLGRGRHDSPRPRFAGAGQPDLEGFLLPECHLALRLPDVLQDGAHRVGKHLQFHSQPLPLRQALRLRTF